MVGKFRNFIISKIRGEVSIEYLKRQGLRVGRNFHKLGGCIIDYSHSWLITIGDNVTLAPRVHILAHDASTKKFLGYTKIGLVNIGDNVFVGADSIILPNVKIGNNVIVGAGSVVTKNIPDNSLVVGNPAKVIGTTEDYINRNREKMLQSPVFGANWTMHKITDSQKKEMIEKLKDGIGFVE